MILEGPGPNAETVYLMSGAVAVSPWGSSEQWAKEIFGLAPNIDCEAKEGAEKLGIWSQF